MNYLKFFGIGVVALSLMPSCKMAEKEKEKTEQPNFLFLFADDQSYNTINNLGNEVMKTPNLDRLVNNGITFTYCFNQGSWSGAVCVASRAMLITGKYIYHARRDVDTAQLWGETFFNAGYKTFMTGKWHNKNHTVLKSFNEARSIGLGMYETKGGMQGPGYNRPTPENNSWIPYDTSLLGHWSPRVKDIIYTAEGKKIGDTYVVNKHTSQLYADNAIEFLENHAAQSNKPFFMYVAFNAPHDPRQSPREFVDMYPSEQIELPENYLPEHPFDQGERYTLRDERLGPFPRTPEAVKVHIQEYYAIISHMDYQIGRILDALEKSGMADNTYIIFSADHGLAVGQHGLLGKQNQYDHSIRMPLIICGPGIEEKVKSKALVYLHNMFATTCELAGIPTPGTVEFKSLVPLITGKEKEGYETIYGSYRSFQRMVRTKDYKLIIYPVAGETQLFNIKNDPWETNNLAGKPEYQEKVGELFEKLQVLQKEVGDTLDLSDYNLNSLKI